MRLNNILYYAAAVLLTISGSGCSGSDDWTPGPQDNTTGVSAYFQVPSKTSYIFDSEGAAEDMNIEITVSRQNTQQEAEVALALDSSAPGIELPAAVKFAAGEASATVTASCAGIEKGRMVKFDVSLPEDQTDVYSIGLNTVSFSVIKADWVVISDNVRYLYSDSAYAPYYPATYSRMYHLEGTTMFRLDDFYGSGLSVMFDCTSPDGTIFMPLDNADFESAAGQDDSPWYLYDEAAGEWPVWTPGNLEGYNSIQFLEFFASMNFSPCYMIYDADTLYGYIANTVGITFGNDDFAWGYFQIDFNLNYNPFDKD